MNAIEALKAVVEVLNHDDDDSRLLWHILTALRGPDNSDKNLKEATTARLRHAIGIKHCPRYCGPHRPYGSNGALLSTEPLPSSSDVYETVLQSAGSHFANHILKAIITIEYFQAKQLLK
jgi:hypothetical protein